MGTLGGRIDFSCKGHVYYTVPTYQCFTNYANIVEQLKAKGHRVFKVTDNLWEIDPL